MYSLYFYESGELIHQINSYPIAPEVGDCLNLTAGLSML